MYLDLMWRSEANEDKFYNTRDWVQIIADETATTLAAVQKVMSLPGTIPQQRQTETHGQQTLPPPGSFPRQCQTETFGQQAIDHPTTDTVKRTIVYDNGLMHKYANQRHGLLAKTGHLHPTRCARDQIPHNNQTTWDKVGRKPQSDTRGGSHSIPRLMDIHIPLVPPHLSVTHIDQSCKKQQRMAPSRKQNLQIMIKRNQMPRKDV